MGRASRQKGARGEREARDLLRDFGFDARRDGRLDDDLDHNIEGYHIEVKRREKLSITEWFKQAERDADGRKVIVLHRRNNEPWRATVDAEVLLSLLRKEQNGY